MKYTSEHAAKPLEIMERLLPQVTFRDEYDELISILRQPERWKEAHTLLKKIGVNITLPSENRRRKTLDFYFVHVAENAAKTAYNCSHKRAPFDEGSYEWFLRCEEEFLEEAAKRG